MTTLVVLSGWLAAAPAALAAPGPPVAPAPAAALMLRFECARCHEGTGIAPPPPEKRCVGCHRDIVAGRFEAEAKVLRTWQKNLVSLRQAPSLAGTHQRLRRAWIEAYLLAPHDLRPGLAATMPRLGLTSAEANTLAVALAHEDPPGPPQAPATPAALARGRALFVRSRCSVCHAFTGAPIPTGRRRSPQAKGHGDASPPDAIALAPDLALVRRRFPPSVLVPFLLDPQALLPGTLMPQTPMSETEARDLAQFLMQSPLATTPAPHIPARLPVLARRVSYAEVETRVLRKVCWHCHAQPDPARGDGGPGNSGGFGYRPRGLDLSSAAGVASGALDEHGVRQSVFRARPDGTPELVGRLLDRQAEEAGQHPESPGMPLGLPALSAEEVQVVESWVAQGRPD